MSDWQERISIGRTACFCSSVRSRSNHGGGIAATNSVMRTRAASMYLCSAALLHGHSWIVPLSRSSTDCSKSLLDTYYTGKFWRSRCLVVDQQLLVLTLLYKCQTGAGIYSKRSWKPGRVSSNVTPGVHFVVKVTFRVDSWVFRVKRWLSLLLLQRVTLGSLSVRPLHKFMSIKLQA
jgi:hypothetical protein